MLEKEQYVAFDLESKTAEINGKKMSEDSAAKLYTDVVREILCQNPELLDSWDARFTRNAVRAERYSGNTVSFPVGGETLYLNIGLNNQAKVTGIKKLCSMCGWEFEERKAGDTALTEQKAVAKNVGQERSAANRAPRPHDASGRDDTLREYADYDQYTVRHDFDPSGKQILKYAYAKDYIFYLWQHRDEQYNCITVIDTKKRAAVRKIKLLNYGVDYNNITVSASGVLVSDELARAHEIVLIPWGRMSENEIDLNKCEKYQVEEKYDVYSTYIHGRKIYTLRGLKEPEDFDYNKVKRSLFDGKANYALEEYDFSNRKSRIIWSTDTLRMDFINCLTDLEDNILPVRKYQELTGGWFVDLFYGYANDRRAIVRYSLMAEDVQDNDGNYYNGTLEKTISIDLLDSSATVLEDESTRENYKIVRFDIEKDRMWLKDCSERGVLFLHSIQPLSKLKNIREAHDAWILSSDHWPDEKNRGLMENICIIRKAIINFIRMTRMAMRMNGIIVDMGVRMPIVL